MFHDGLVSGLLRGPIIANHDGYHLNANLPKGFSPLGRSEYIVPGYLSGNLYDGDLLSLPPDEIGQERIGFRFKGTVA